MWTRSSPAGLQIGLVPKVRGQAGRDRGVIHGVMEGGGVVGGHEPEEARLLLRESDRVRSGPPLRGQARAPLQVDLPGVGDLAGGGGVNVARLGGEVEDRGQPAVVGGGGGGGWDLLAGGARLVLGGGGGGGGRGLDGEGRVGKEAGGHCGGGDIERDRGRRRRCREELALFNGKI
ncbi:hypothetical protein BT93_C0667 [Corymbia citriodora subsp. variegata]|nr:hypothetical protein BT93_C0667 [Corymbia citriodora subsp. variegata]